MQILYSYSEAAGLLGLPTAQALRDLVYKGRGPVATRIGARVLFAYADLTAWAAAHRDIAPASPLQQANSPLRKRGRPSVADRQREIQQQR